jgi:hypothetical protein
MSRTCPDAALGTVSGLPLLPYFSVAGELGILSAGHSKHITVESGNYFC